MATRDEVYRKFGEVAEAAQLFETNVGTAILSLTGLSKDWHKNPDPDAARTVLESIDRKTLGSLLIELKKYVLFDSKIEARLQNALSARNRLIHGFYEKHGFKIFQDDGAR